MICVSLPLQIEDINVKVMIKKEKKAQVCMIFNSIAYTLPADAFRRAAGQSGDSQYVR